MDSKKVYTDRSCFVPGCKTGYSDDKKSKKLAGEINPSLFKAPNVSKKLIQILNNVVNLYKLKQECGFHVILMKNINDML